MPWHIMPWHMKVRMPFVDRRQQLADLGTLLTRAPVGGMAHRAVIAARRLGKTELIKEFIRRHPKEFLPFVEVQAADLTASSFVRQILLAYLVALSRPSVAPLPTSANIIGLAGTLPVALRQKVVDLLNAAESEALPDNELRAQVLRFGEELMRSLNKRGVLFLDECQDWFAPPGEQPSAMESVLAEAVNAAQRLRFVVSGSAQRVMEATFQENPKIGERRRPLHGRFHVLYLAELMDRDAKDLVEKLWKGSTYGAEATTRVFTLTRGHPGALVTVAELAAAKARSSATEITPELVSHAFVESLFEPLGLLNALALADYNSALGAVRSQKTMARLLRAIAEAGPAATGTELARRTKVKQPNIKEMLTPLLHADLVRLDEETKTYRFSSPFLPMWLRGRDAWAQSGGVGHPYTTVLQVVQEELERAREELASSAESVARDAASHFDGGPMPGALFGRPGTTVVLPHTTKLVRTLTAVDRSGIAFPKGTSIQIDLIVDAADAWIAEVKSGGGRVTAALVKRLHDKAVVLRHEKIADPKVLWFVSASGYDKKALDFAKKHGMYISRSADVRRIQDLLRQPPTSPRRTGAARRSKP